MTENDPAHLLIVWATGEKETSLHMVLLYAINARRKGWWPKVTLLVWGASASLAAQDEEVQAQIAAALAAGVRIIACKRCAENLQIVDELTALQMELFYTGEFLTDWLQSGSPMLSV